MARGGHPGYMLSLASGTDQCSDGSGGGRRLRFHGRYGLIGTPCVSPAPGSRPRRDPAVCLAWMSSLDPLPGGSACEDAVGRPEAQVSPVSAALSLAAAAVPAPACPLPCHFKPGARLRVGNRAGSAGQTRPLGSPLLRGREASAAPVWERRKRREGKALSCLERVWPSEGVVVSVP